MPTLATKSRSASARSPKLRYDHDLRSMRSALISFLGIDAEGQYRPKFVDEALEASDSFPTYIFEDAKSFLAKLKSL